MRYQTTDYNCGPAALQNACKVLRHSVTQDRLADIAGTTEAEGTDEHGIQRAVLAQGLGFDVVEESQAATAWSKVMWHLLMGRPLVLSVDRWGHWVTAVGFCGGHVLVAEPARYPYVVRENGILVMNKERLLKRWRAARRVAGKAPPYYGLAIGPVP